MDGFVKQELTEPATQPPNYLLTSKIDFDCTDYAQRLRTWINNVKPCLSLIITMEPISNQPGEDDARHAPPNQRIESLNREKYEDIASSAAHFVRVAVRFLWGVVIVACGFSVIVWGDLRLLLAAILRVLIRGAQSLVVILESEQEHVQDRATRLPQMIPECRVPANYADSEMDESAVDENDTESVAFEPYNGGRSHVSRVIGVEDACIVVLSKSEKLARGRERIRALREERRLKGLKVHER